VGVPKAHLQSATSRYRNVQSFIDEWHGVAVAALSDVNGVRVDTRVGRGDFGLYLCSCLIYRAAPYISPWES
jgi:hypothetical protein